jgi:hypothetical protein
MHTTPHCSVLRPSTPLLAALALCAGLLAPVAGVHAQCVTSFVQPYVGYSSPNPGAYRIISRDLNGDGRLDLITINPSAGRTVVNLATGNGTFGPDVNYSAGAAPVSMALSDINADGRPDLVVLSLGGNSMHGVMMGNADGTFGSLIFATVAGQFNHIAAADFNGDGRGDIVMASNNALSIKVGNGDGTFGPGIALSVGGASQGISWMATGDFNGDGKPDIACALSANNSVSVLLNTSPLGGNPTFAAAVNYPVGASPQHVVVGDVNGDGRADLITANRTGNSMSVLLCNANGTFANGPGGGTYAVGTAANHLALGDFNGDGFVDVAMSHFNLAALTVMHGTGTGAFGNAVGFVVPVSDCLAAGDYTGDGRLDVIGSAVASLSDHFWMLPNNSPGAPAPTFTLQPVSQVVAAGGTVNLTANVSSAQTYQWRRNGLPINDGDLIWGAATNTLTITQASAADMAVYELRASSVSCSGTTNSALSTPAVVAVTPSTAPVAPSNDACVNAINISNGPTPFDTTAATTDGPTEANLGFCCNDLQVNKDVWFVYTATCSGPVTASTCGSTFDTKIAVYNDAICPSGPSTAIAGNDDYGACGGTGLTSQTTFNAIAGHRYMIRVGGYTTSSGSGTLTMSCNGSGCLTADLGVQGGGPGRDGQLDNNDFIAFIDAFFSHTGCP